MGDEINPSHYKKYPFEVIELTKDMTFPFGNIIKYLLRAPFKGKLEQDLGKAAWYAAFIQMQSDYQTPDALRLAYADAEELGYATAVIPYKLTPVVRVQVEAVMVEAVEDERIRDEMIEAFRQFYRMTTDSPEYGASHTVKHFRLFIESVIRILRKVGTDEH